MTEEPMVYQTFEPEDVANWSAIQSWVDRQYNHARDRGGRWPRVSMTEDRMGLLLEVWTKRPKDEGPLRWQMEVAQ